MCACVDSESDGDNKLMDLMSSLYDNLRTRVASNVSSSHTPGSLPLHHMLLFF